MEEVVLVDNNDVETGRMEKQQAHVEGLLHRAISVFIFNKNNELLLHQRAASKYHSGSLWTNACCSHPRPGEEPLAAAHRRLYEEMGLSCELTPAFTFLYKAALNHGLTEHEYDHVFVGYSDDTPQPDPNEVAAWAYIPWAQLDADIALNPSKYTPWFRICIQDHKSQLFNTRQS